MSVDRKGSTARIDDYGVPGDITSGKRNSEWAGEGIAVRDPVNYLDDASGKR
jgi:hypothetical protein